MRLMLRFTLPVEKGNEAEADGSLSIAIKELVEQLQPEAAYFHLQDGKRAGTIVFEESHHRLVLKGITFTRPSAAGIIRSPQVPVDVVEPVAVVEE